MATPLVSIIVPCYKHAEYLPDALDSVLEQTYSNWECIIVNDASPDNTVEVASAYVTNDARFRLLNKQNNEGLSAARNSGIAATSGMLILPLDADDKLSPEYLEESVRILTEKPSVKVVYTDVIHFGSRNDITKRPEFHLRDLCYQNIFQPCAMFKRIDFNKTDGYRENMIYGYEDWDFWFQIISSDVEVFHIHKPLFYFRVKGGSMISKLSSDPALERQMRQTIISNNRSQFESWAPEILGTLNYKKRLRRFAQRLKQLIGFQS